MKKAPTKHIKDMIAREYNEIEEEKQFWEKILKKYESIDITSVSISFLIVALFYQ